MSQRPALILDRYLPLKAFRGGMGVVHLCGDMVERRAVAVKTFLPHLLSDAAIREQFVREASTWLQIGEHPHVVTARMVRRDDEQVYVICDLVAPPEDATSAALRSWLGRPLAPFPVFDFALGIVRGMRWATSRIPGLVHRDLKPENILVGRDRRARVTDFGLARRAGEGGSIAGTPAYMAPEQFTGSVDPRSDIYAFGLIFLEMLTGSTGIPRGATIGSIRLAHESGVAQQRAAKLPEPLRAIAFGCLHMDPAARPASWAELEDMVLAAWDEVLVKPPPQLPEPAAASAEAQELVLWSELSLANALLDLGATRDAIQGYTAVLGRARAAGAEALEAAALGGLGQTHTIRGEMGQAFANIDASLAIRRKRGDRLGEAKTLTNRGNALARSAKLDDARADHERAASIFFELGSQDEYVHARFNVVPVLLQQKRLDDAIDGARWCRDAFRERGDVRGEAMALGTLGQALRHSGSLEPSLEASVEALACFEKIADRVGQARELSLQGTVLRALGKNYDALGVLTRSLALAEEVGDRYLVGVVSYSLAQMTPNLAPVNALGRQYAASAAAAYRAVGRDELARDADALVAKFDAGPD